MCIQLTIDQEIYIQQGIVNAFSCTFGFFANGIYTSNEHHDNLVVF